MNDELKHNLAGTRAVFWDMRDSFIFSLYRDSVEGARMQIFIPTIDQVGKPHLRYLVVCTLFSLGLLLALLTVELDICCRFLIRYVI
jgi:hypothetical protein